MKRAKPQASHTYLHILLTQFTYLLTTLLQSQNQHKLIKNLYLNVKNLIRKVINIFKQIGSVFAVMSSWIALTWYSQKMAAFYTIRYVKSEYDRIFIFLFKALLNSRYTYSTYHFKKIISSLYKSVYIDVYIFCSKYCLHSECRFNAIQDDITDPFASHCRTSEPMKGTEQNVSQV